MKLELKNEELDVIAAQLQQVVATGNVLGYLENNINYDIDIDLAPSGDLFTKRMLVADTRFALAENADFSTNRFLGWWERSELVKKIKRAICTVVDEIRRLIDEEAELKKILEVALLAVAAVVGIAINPVVITIVVGLLATMILKGVATVCPV